MIIVVDKPADLCSDTFQQELFLAPEITFYILSTDWVNLSTYEKSYLAPYKNASKLKIIEDKDLPFEQMYRVSNSNGIGITIESCSIIVFCKIFNATILTEDPALLKMALLEDIEIHESIEERIIKELLKEVYVKSKDKKNQEAG